MTRTLNILGAGRVGASLGRLWHQKGTFKVQDVYTRDLEHSERATTFIGAGRAVASLDDMRAAHLYLIASVDDAIVSLVRTLFNGLIGPQTIVFHVSGAYSSRRLAATRACGAATASAHPVTSFADPDAVVRQFMGTFCALEGDVPAIDLLSDAFEAIGARIVRIAPSDKLLYHAGAVFASNYLAALLEVSLALFTLAGIERERSMELVKPLVRQTVENVFRLGPVNALGGPLVRGDVSLVRAQYAVLCDNNPQIAELYRLLAAHTAQLAGRGDPLA